MTVIDFNEQAAVALEQVPSDASWSAPAVMVVYDDTGYVVDWQIETEDSASLVLVANDVPW